MKHKTFLNFARFVSLVIMLSFVCPGVYAEDAKKETSSSSAELEQAMSHLEPFLQTHFPRAKVMKTPKSIHFEFKARKFATVSGEVLSPESNGIVGDMEVKTGRHKSKHSLPQTINETLYITIIWAPYSEAQNSHVLTKVLFPHDLDISVIDEFKSKMDQFVTAVEANNSTKVAEAPPEKKPEPVAVPAVTVKQPAASAVSAAATDSGTRSSNSQSGDAISAALQASNAAQSIISDQTKAAEAAYGAPEAFGPPTSTSDDDIAAKTEVKKVVPKTLPKPTPQYIKSWFTHYFNTMGRSHYIPQIAHFFSAHFRATTATMKGVERMDARTAHSAFNVFKATTYLTSWKIDKIQPGPGGCTDVIVLGETTEGHPGYIIFRMIPENGTWVIDSGRIRAWYTR